jgi:hypothetical protein
VANSGLFPVWSSRQVIQRIDDFVDMRERKVIETLSYVGERFVNAARSTQTYRDQTGNLRSSIGYVIVKDGKIVKGNFQGKRDGVARARETAATLATEVRSGFAIIGFAGMEYAASVESRGRDVITGSVPMSAELLGILKKELALEEFI